MLRICGLSNTNTHVAIITRIKKIVLPKTYVEKKILQSIINTYLDAEKNKHMILRNYFIKLDFLKCTFFKLSLTCFLHTSNILFHRLLLYVFCVSKRWQKKNCHPQPSPTPMHRKSRKKKEGKKWSKMKWKEAAAAKLL